MDGSLLCQAGSLSVHCIASPQVFQSFLKLAQRESTLLLKTCIHVFIYLTKEVSAKCQIFSCIPRNPYSQGAQSPTIPHKRCHELKCFCDLGLVKQTRKCERKETIHFLKCCFKPGTFQRGIPNHPF